MAHGDAKDQGQAAATLRFEPELSHDALDHPRAAHLAFALYADAKLSRLLRQDQGIYIRPAAAVKPRGDLKLHRDLFAKQLEPWHPRPWRHHLYFDYVFCRLRIRHQPHHAHEQPQILELAECLLDAHYAGSLRAWA